MAENEGKTKLGIRILDKIFQKIDEIYNLGGKQNFEVYEEVLEKGLAHSFL